MHVNKQLLTSGGFVVLFSGAAFAALGMGVDRLLAQCSRVVNRKDV